MTYAPNNVSRACFRSLYMNSQRQQGYNLVLLFPVEPKCLDLDCALDESEVLVDHSTFGTK